MRTNGLSQNDVYKKLNNILMVDETFSSGKIIGSMCTKPHIFSQKIYSKHLEKNIGDPGLLKGTSKLEKDIIASAKETQIHCNSCQKTIPLKKILSH